VLPIIDQIICFPTCLSVHFSRCNDKFVNDLLCRLQEIPKHPASVFGFPGVNGSFSLVYTASRFEIYANKDSPFGRVFTNLEAVYTRENDPLTPGKPKTDAGWKDGGRFGIS
jgi:hypothetical protein